MAYQISLNPEQMLVKLLHQGDNLDSESRQTRKEVSSALLEDNRRRVLVDIRDVNCLPSVIDQYEFITAHGYNLPFSVCIASVVSQDKHDVGEFVENVAQNAGINQRIFENVD